MARRKHDIIPIVISDPREAEMPNVGLVRSQDEETGESITLDLRTGGDIVEPLLRYFHKRESRQ